jgi:N-acetylglutamate synthase/N-acetylornithine aminotransferase
MKEITEELGRLADIPHYGIQEVAALFTLSQAVNHAVYVERCAVKRQCLQKAQVLIQDGARALTDGEGDEAARRLLKVASNWLAQPGLATYGMPAP